MHPALARVALKGCDFGGFTHTISDFRLQIAQLTQREKEVGEAAFLADPQSAICNLQSEALDLVISLTRADGTLQIADFRWGEGRGTTCHGRSVTKLVEAWDGMSSGRDHRQNADFRTEFWECGRLQIAAGRSGRILTATIWPTDCCSEQNSGARGRMHPQNADVPQSARSLRFRNGATKICQSVICNL